MSDDSKKITIAIDKPYIQKITFSGSPAPRRRDLQADQQPDDARRIRVPADGGTVACSSEADCMPFRLKLISAVSKPLSKPVKAAGLERRGMWNLEKLTKGKETPFKGIDDWKLAASDHAAVWVDLKL